MGWCENIFGYVLGIYSRFMRIYLRIMYRIVEARTWVSYGGAAGIIRVHIKKEYVSSS